MIYDKNLKLHAVTTKAIAIKKLFHTPLHTEHPADAERLGESRVWKQTKFKNNIRKAVKTVNPLVLMMLRCCSSRVVAGLNVPS